MTTLLESRRCYQALNPLHSLIYFAPEAEEEFTAAGLRPGRMSYFAGRSAAMGAVGPGTVTATFFNFSPALVAKHIPRAWELAAPAAVLDARLRAVDRALRRLFGAEALADPALAEAAELAGEAATACSAAGRPLYAAHAELPVPDQPHLALWHAITLLREHRGDGHLAALTAAELDGIDALVTHTATGKAFTPEFARASRGWSEEEWSACEQRLRDRGLLDAEGKPTEPGREQRHQVEALTDTLGHGPYQHLGEAGVARLTEIAGRLAQTALANGAFPPGVFATR
ncbi:SCO6745 family protein [Streptacidiphilus cavernicola]|uniref:SalK n=1 Tax=Streptacidiphilus cavernicola TaxID=3342716 RepID=A0ABV6W405_9ACTN